MIDVSWGNDLWAERDFNLKLYADADDPDNNRIVRRKIDRPSVSGGAILCGGAPITCLSRVQKCVTLSTTEAAYVAMGDDTKEAFFVKGVLRPMLLSDRDVSNMEIEAFENNQGGKSLAENTLSSSTRSTSIDFVTQSCVNWWRMEIFKWKVLL